MRLIAIATSLAFSSTTAIAACDANTDVLSDCLDGAKKAAVEVFRTDDDKAKGEAVGESSGNCVQCASEHLADKMRQLSNDQPGQIYNGQK
ncbi:hypothetical protein [Rhizobium ruizarguesonis]|jgi:cytochrome c-type biogenesis protein CcmH/NrfF|uniref:hypothetical protein n=1 Tax=Rhizobium ruizarguesonis TaxID=2081791 RepID=UPI001030CE9B|nr:hypothetical protein [Rhizobium ruizarguesonis]TBA80344.1 hypothetical protein ELH56_08895 [Rhizobium ruizarguesonis]